MAESAAGHLTAHRYTRARLSDALWHGVAGTAMQAWRDHTVEDLAALATAVDRLASTDVDAADGPGDQLARGAQVYLTHCAQCHGTDGDGRGSAAAQLRVAPTNFRRQRATASLTLAAIGDGVEVLRWRPGPAASPPTSNAPSPSTYAGSSCPIRPGQAAE